LRLFFCHRAEASQQSQTSAGDNSLRHSRLGGADCIVERLLLGFHLGLGGGSDADHRDASGQPGGALLELFTVVVTGCLFYLPANLLDPFIDLLASAAAADDRGVALVDNTRLALPSCPIATFSAPLPFGS
jgi:hypothetical protein